DNKPAEKKAIRTRILTPTRELAIQVGENYEIYGTYSTLNNLAIYVGVPQQRQIAALNKAVDIVVATPGGLLELKAQGVIALMQIEILVLDEADRMLDMGFVNDVKKILTKVPVKRQTLFFSATMPAEIRKFSQTILSNPKEINVTPVSSTAQTIKQSV